MKQPFEVFSCHFSSHDRPGLDGCSELIVWARQLANLFT